MESCATGAGQAIIGWAGIRASAATSERSRNTPSPARRQPDTPATLDGYTRSMPRSRWRWGCRRRPASCQPALLVTYQPPRYFTGVGRLAENKSEGSERRRHTARGTTRLLPGRFPPSHRSCVVAARGHPHQPPHVSYPPSISVPRWPAMEAVGLDSVGVQTGREGRASSPAAAACAEMETRHVWKQPRRFVGSVLSWSCAGRCAIWQL